MAIFSSVVIVYMKESLHEWGHLLQLEESLHESVWSAVVDNIRRDDSSHELHNDDTNIDVMMVVIKPEPPYDDWKMVVTCNGKV